MSDYLDPNNEELLKDFFVEAYAQVDSLEQNILVLENDPRNHDAIDEIFRAAHTLKGGSATVEMGELSSFTHAVEDLLDSIRSGETLVDSDISDSLLEAVDSIKSMLGARAQGHPDTGDVEPLKARLRAFLPAKPGKKNQAAPASQVQAAPRAQAVAPSPAKAVSTAPASGGGLTEYEILELREAAGPDMDIYRVSVDFNEDNPMNSVGGIQVFASLKDAGKVLKTQPDFEALYGDTFFPVVEYFLATAYKAADLGRFLNIPDVVLSHRVEELGAIKSSKPDVAPAPAPAAIRQEAPKPSPKPAPAQPKPEVKQSRPEIERQASPAVPARAEAPKPAPAEANRGDDEEAKKAAAQAGSILRVDSKRIDNLLNLVSETVITKATFNQVSTQFGELLNDIQAIQSGFRGKMKDLLDGLPERLRSLQEGQSIKELKKALTEEYGELFSMYDPVEANLKSAVAKYRSTAQNLGRITGELQEGVMRIRMVPISQIFSRFPRLVRDLSKNLGKKVNLVVEGEDTELDKSVIEDLLDPLMHSVRNALDHGVEAPADRLAAGKSEEGIVLLKASNEGNLIVIEVSDDGKGIDVEAVRQKAIERGLIHPSKSLTDIEAFNLIFEPGFSTAKTITNISGRGVGLDVVRTQIEKLNGSVTVSSQKGKGTRFTIKLPLTLAIIQGLLVRVGQEVYSIPITSVLESHRIKQEDIMMIDNYEVINIRSDVISLIRLDRLFRIKTEEKREYFFVVIVGTSEKKMGLMVDTLIGEEDVVIKPLRDSFTNSPGIAGASILGDGSVSLIIDVSQLLELGLKSEMEERRRREATIR